MEKDPLSGGWATLAVDQRSPLQSVLQTDEVDRTVTVLGNGRSPEGWKLR